MAHQKHTTSSCFEVQGFLPCRERHAKRLADLLGMHKSSITQMKTDERPCNLRVRAKLAEIADYDLQTAVIEGVIGARRGVLQKKKQHEDFARSSKRSLLGSWRRWE